VQLGGAAGTLASLGEQGLQVVELLAAELNLPVPDLPWHTERDRVAEIAATLGIVSGVMSKIAGDIALLAQTEVGEVSEGAAPGKGGSSAMPQKRNPVDATGALASARLAIGIVPVILSAMQQEHERAVGGWQAEWDAIPNLFCYTAGAVERVQGALSGLEVDEAHMKANLDASDGLIMSESLTMALAHKVGRPEAFRIVQSIGKQSAGSGKTLRQAALENEEMRAFLSPEEIDSALDPARYLGSTNAFIDRALVAYRDQHMEEKT
jgi:3-carboxy-cis,cis-muconate cycloisomerase